MTTCSRPLKSFMLGLIDVTVTTVSPKPSSTNHHTEAANVQEEEEDLKSLFNGSCKITPPPSNSNNCNRPSDEVVTTLKTKTILNGSPCTNGDIPLLATDLERSESGISLANHCNNLNKNSQETTTTTFEELHQPLDEKSKNKKNEDVVDSGGEYNDDTDTETITSENTEEVISSSSTSSLSSSSSNNKEEASELEPVSETLEEPPPVSEINDLVQEEVSQAVDELKSQAVQTTREDMDLFDDHHHHLQEEELATQITVGEVHNQKDITTTTSTTGQSERRTAEEQEEEGGMSYVLRINTADEHSHNVIHSTNWDEATESNDDEGDGDDDDSTTTTDEDRRIYNNNVDKCVDVKMMDKRQEMQQNETGINTEEKCKEQTSMEVSNHGEETVRLDSESLQEIEAERRRIIANQVVRGRRIDTWLLPEAEAAKSASPEIVTTLLPKTDSEEQEQVTTEPDEAFFAVPVMLQSQQREDEEDYEDDSLDVTQEQAGETTINGDDDDGGGDRFSEEEQLVTEMTSFENHHQPQSLDASDFTHEPDSLDMVPDNELDEEQQQNAKNYNINCNGGFQTSETPKITEVTYLNHVDAKNKAVAGFNGSLSTATWQEMHGAYAREESIIDREVRSALEREEEFRKQLSRKNNDKNNADNSGEQANKLNGNGVPVQEVPNDNDGASEIAANQSAYFKTQVLSEIRSRDANMVLSMENGTRSTIGNAGGDDPVLGGGNRDLAANPLESVIQREIRQQNEREEALAQERQMAQMAAQMKNQLAHNNKPTPLENGTFINGSALSAKTATGKEHYHHQRYPQTVLECDIIIRDQRNNAKLHSSREFSANDSGIESPLNSDPCLIELGGGSSSDDGENSDGLIPVFHHHHHHQRAESLDSLGSAGTPSSNSSTSAEPPLPRRQVKVKPLVDEEVDSRPTYQVLKESPIEREIRLAREREEALRREKGLPTPLPTSPPPPISPSNSEPNALLSNSKKQAASAAAASWVRSRAMDLNNPKEQRSVQWRLATSRIQQEIEEQTQRELALRATGSIRTTSEDHVDSKITRLTEVLAESSNNSKFSLSPPSTPDSERTSSSSGSSSNIAPLSPVNHVSVCNSFNKNNNNTLPAQNHHSGRMFVKSGGTCGMLNGSSQIMSTLPRRPLSGTGKGVMQKFIASRGKVVPSFTSARSISTSNLSMYAHGDGTECTREQLMKEIRASPPRNVKRTYCSAETKIQNELQHMKVREEELRLVRAKTFAMSQPNLLSIIDDDDDDDVDSVMNNNNMGNLPLREKFSSNPNLLDDESPEAENQMVQTKPAACRRRSALIAQWEEKIQQNCDN